MTTIINTPPQPAERSESGAGIVLGVIVALVLVAIFFIFVLPALRGSYAAPSSGYTAPTGGNVNVNLQAPASSAAPSGSAY